MNYGEIKKNDIANGIGVRVSIFVSGCRHCCPDCFNQMTWDFGYGKPYTDETEQYIIDCLAPDYIRGITLIGGEPFEKENQAELVKLLKRIRTELPQKDVWCYSGFTYEQITGQSRASGDMANELLSLIDVLVDGRFEKDKKNITLRFRGSENQRIIDVKKTKQQNKIVLWQ